MPKLSRPQGMGVAQEGKNECWFACYLMVKYYMAGRERTYGQEKELLRGEPWYKEYAEMCGADPFRAGAGADFIALCLTRAGFPHQVLHRAGPEDAAPFIAGDRPVILGLDRGAAFGHFVAVTAIEGAAVAYLDPQSPGRPAEGLWDRLRIGCAVVPGE